MKPSQNFIALMWAFNLSFPKSLSNGDLRQMEQSLLESVAYETAFVDTLLHGVKSTNPYNKQCRFDALLSIACDYGVDALTDTKLPSLIQSASARRDVVDAIMSIPAFGDTIRPELLPQIQQYKLISGSRRHFEAELYCGNVLFCIMPQRSSEGKKVFAPTVLSPFYRFLLACYKEK